MVSARTILGAIVGLAALTTAAPAPGPEPIAAPEPVAAPEPITPPLVGEPKEATPHTIEARRTWAGGVDMNQQCAWQYGDTFFATQPFWPYGDAYTWACATYGQAVYYSVDVGAYCRRRYGGNAYADPQGGGAYDWGCYFP
ncbi:hypothetical protein B0T25DRAFT_565434 [Lasiosphaeria hispida]|uniref:Uncharacterized protein n=1 Tax=Lasiosphaeria hispida TaxID=260671 RepID=A0AAJ0HSN4_9PEZI|nr:hypothetical protein B0T25DRAFT_565434 [Lasiosphaeria hispida]